MTKTQQLECPKHGTVTPIYYDDIDYENDRIESYPCCPVCYNMLDY